MAAEFIGANGNGEERVVQNGQRRLDEDSKWSFPARGRVKINFDGARVDRDEGPKAGAGVVIRNEIGRFVAACAMNLGAVLSAVCAKALACRGALVFASELGLNSVIVEGDSQQMVQILGNKRSCPTGLDVVVEDIWRLAERFQSFEFLFARRSANVVAHKLANSGLRGSKIRT